ncbi:MAG: aldehyde dehydrogenase (NADP(+)) [Acidobacteriota bacterium]
MNSGTYPDATPEQIDGAFAFACRASWVLRETGAERRARFLDEIAARILALGAALLDVCSRETALPIARLVSERARTVDQLAKFAAHVREGSWLDATIDHADPDRRPVPKPDVRRMNVPVGPVVVFGASNFPLAFSVAGGDTASAIAAGCPVIVKAHPAHPETSELVAGAIEAARTAAGMPEGTFALLHGASPAVGRALVAHPGARVVAFTGSLRGGRALLDVAAARPEPIPVHAEMGSTNPVFVLPGAMEERAGAIAAGLHQSFTLGVGQFCTNPGLVFALAGNATDRFVAELDRLVASTPPATMLTPAIQAAFDAGVARRTHADGVQVLARGIAGPGAAPVVARTTAVAFLREPALLDEVFGPFTLVVVSANAGELLDLARALPGQLTATVHAVSEDFDRHPDLIALLGERAGRLVCNGFPTGVEVCPSMHHGGPYPATTDPRSTSVGIAAMRRFLRPLCFQGFPQKRLPPELQDDNPLRIPRLVDGTWLR